MLTVVLLLLIVVLPLLIVLYLLLIAFTLLLTVSGSLVQVQSCPDSCNCNVSILQYPLLLSIQYCTVNCYGFFNFLFFLTLVCTIDNNCMH